ncbi:MAG: pirin family protein [candidate division FCPU426 bacterium]
MDPILEIQTLAFPWACLDPFLFCVHHVDLFPAGNAKLGPAASLEGRDLGQDFAAKDGWNMYHGETVPGFPAHPHRGFETVTVVRQGLIDHADSLGAAARYGQGDTQWLTTGAGIVHSEMFPLLKSNGPNTAELFQIWLNLPASKKKAAPNFQMLWADQIPHRKQDGVELTLIAGALGEQCPPSPPPDSWAADPATEVAIWIIQLEPGATWTLPAASAGLNRALYFYEGGTLKAADQECRSGQRLRLRSDAPLPLINGAKASSLLLLQGRPIGEPVAQYGPFVMNREVELEKAFEDYRKTRFGGWPWPVADPVHSASQGRFARHPDGRQETR